jgi:hypothetical protein
MARKIRLFRAAKAAKQLAGNQSPNKSRRAVTARANARVLLKQFGRDGVVILLAMRENIRETLTFLEQERGPSCRRHGNATQAYALAGWPYFCSSTGRGAIRVQRCLDMGQIEDKSQLINASSTRVKN